jgi:hypothetical protein
LCSLRLTAGMVARSPRGIASIPFRQVRCHIPKHRTSSSPQPLPRPCSSSTRYPLLQLFCSSWRNFAKKRNNFFLWKCRDFGEFPSPEVEKRKNRQISSVFGFFYV